MQLRVFKKMSSYNCGGCAFALQDVGKHIITTKVEHQAVEETVKYLASKFGYEVTFVDVDSTGKVSADEIVKHIRKDTILVSVMHSNNEVGTLQPIAEIGKLIKTKYPHVLFHTDCSQSIGKVKVDVNGTLKIFFTVYSI
jgi:cysteine desulfurase